MRAVWKVAVVAACVGAMLGAAALWQAHRHRVRLAEEAKAVRAKAEQGDAKAEARLGSMYYYGEGELRDYGEAIRWWNKAAAQGNAWAEYDLGYLYQLGQGVQQDDAEAARWYGKAAEQGEARAEVALGTMYYYGQGVTEDREVAAAWYRKAAEKGLAHAQYYLGYVYAYGQGVPQDQAEADRWYRKAASQGDRSAQQALGLRGYGPSLFLKVLISMYVLGSLLILVGSLWPGRGIAGPERRAAALTGMLGLFYAGLDLYGSYYISDQRPGGATGVFYFVKFALGGIFIVLLVSLIFSLARPKRAKVALGAVGICFVIFNLLAILAAAHYNLWHLAAARRGFEMIDGNLVGMSIALAVFLWRGRDRASEDNTLDGVADGEVG